MPVYSDQLGNTLELDSTPKRIISIVPSQSELLFDLGLDNEVVGITKFCVHPQHWLKEKSVIGGTKKLHIEKIRSLDPDLVIANKEENNKEDIESIEVFCPVWVSDVKDVESALEMIQSMGDLVGKRREADELFERIYAGFQRLKNRQLKKAIYLIWRNPYMAAGSDTFIHDIMNRVGYKNLVSANRYPEITLSEMKSLDPDIVLLSSEPYPFREKHIEKLNSVFDCDIKLVDGELFSWYGSRMLKAINEFNK